MIVFVKQKYTDPFVILAGDFNQWKISQTILDFPDLKEAQTGPTRNDKNIDKIFTNISRSISEAGTLASLETEDGSRASNHRTAYCKAELARLRTFTWEKYTYRHYNEESVQKFKEWVVLHDWKEVLEASGSNNKADAYQRAVGAALERYFPLKTTHRKSTDLPWMNKKTRKMIWDRKKLFWQEGGKRTPVWKAEKKEWMR